MNRTRIGIVCALLAGIGSTAAPAQCRFGTTIAVPALKPGDAAPPFSLTGSDGKTYTLSELKGRYVVLSWFAKAFTGG